MARQDPNNVCEETVYASVFKQWAKSLRDYLYYTSGNLGLSEDIVQDVFFKLWERCKDVPLDKAKSFLFTAARNKFFNEAEKQKVRLKYSQQLNTTVNKEDPAFILEKEEYKQRLEAAIAALPDGQREVFLLNRINKMTYAEIAEALEISQKAVEKRMSKALRKLKDVLNPKK